MRARAHAGNYSLSPSNWAIEHEPLGLPEKVGQFTKGLLEKSGLSP